MSVECHETRQGNYKRQLTAKGKKNIISSSELYTLVNDAEEW